MKNVYFLFMLGLLISACTWVELSDEGKNVRIVSMNDIKACKKMGTVTVSLKDKIAGFDRNQDKVKRELEHLARNMSVDLKGDSIVPVSPIKNGKQTFAVYKCVNSTGTE